ncbi:MAG: polysaccharide biosynthesis tyrosine autokinase, partial [Porphyromonadaceae bacterium]|nr:polysaccharide biosynthesis tyrosine autokinase [Porphyromonadaceae bacterium]
MYYKSAKQAYTYESVVTVIVRDPAQRTSIDLDLVGRRSRVNIENERLQLRSRIVIADAIKAINAQVNYGIVDGLRPIELYKSAPIQISFTDSLDHYDQFNVSYKDASTVVVSREEGGEQKQVSLGEEVVYDNSRFVIVPSKGYNEPWPNKTLKITRLPVKDLAASYQGRLSIGQPENRATVLSLTLTDNSKQRATDLLEAIVDAYNAETSSVRNQIAINTARFINERIANLSEELDVVANNIDSFQRANKFIAPEVIAGAYTSRAQSGHEASFEIEAQKRLARYFLDFINNPSKQGDYLPQNIGLNNAGLETAISAYNQIKPEYERWLSTTGGMEDHPMVQKYAKAMEQTRVSIRHTLEGYIKTLDLQLREIDIRNRQGMEEMITVPNKQRQWLDIERQQRMKEALYTQLLSKREENTLAQTAQSNNAYVMDFDTGSNSPISPNTTRTLLISFAIGLFIPTVFFLLKLLTDTKIRTRKDILDRVSIPYLGDIPLAESSTFVSVEPQGTDTITEAFRVLRTNMGFMKKMGGTGQRIMCVSFGASAGKTFTTYNLARSLIFADKKVVIVDLDLRKGTLTRRLEMAGRGVTNYLSDETISVADVLRHDKSCPGLAVIPIGSSAPNPAELLMSERLDTLMDTLSESYDYVLIDGVPFGIVADATIVNRVVDLTLFIIRSGVVDRRVLPDLQSLYDEKILSNMAIVLNGVSSQNKGYGYGYGYGYG